MWKISLIILILFLYSCFRNENSTVIIENNEIIPWNLCSEASSNNPFKKNHREYIFLKETPDRKMLSNIQEIIYNNGKLFIRDNRYINVYNEDGKYINSIGEIGRAKNEYYQINDISIMSDTIYVLDNTNDRLITYDIDGNFICDNVLPISLIAGISVTKQGFILYRPIYKGEETNQLYEYAMTFTDKNLNIKSQFIKYDKNSPIVNNGTPFVETDSLISFNLFLTDEIYLINRNNLNKQVLNIDFMNWKIPIDKKNDNEFVFSDMNDCYYMSCTPIIENNLLIGRAVKKRKRVNFAIDLITKEVFEDDKIINLYPSYYGKLKDFFLSPIEYNGDNDEFLGHQFPDSVNRAVMNGDVVILKFKLNEKED